jgi:hypothetical protein
VANETERLAIVAVGPEVLFVAQVGDAGVLGGKSTEVARDALVRYPSSRTVRVQSGLVWPRMLSTACFIMATSP